MARNFSVPIYAIQTIAGSNFPTTVRTLTTAGQDATDDDTTRSRPNGGLSGASNGYFNPYVTLAAGETSVPVNAVGTRSNRGWVYDATPLLTPANAAFAFDKVTILSGTASVVVRLSRTAGLGTANHTTSITAILHWVYDDEGSNIELGRATVSGITVTTTKTNTTINIPITGSAFPLSARQFLFLEIYYDTNSNGAVNSAVILSTDSTNGLRITAMPQYTVQTARAVSDSMAFAESLARTFSGSRSITDSSGPVTDNLTRLYTASRTLSETHTPVNDSIVRSFTGSRSMSDSVGPVVDTLTRAYTGVRLLNDSVGPVNDSLVRIYTAARFLSDTYNTVQDSISRLFVANRTLSDSSGPIVDSLTRSFTGSRSMSDSVGPINDILTRTFTGSRSISDSSGPVVDTLTRQFIANRALSDSLTPVSDDLDRIYIGTRSMSDSTGPVVDTLTRSVVYARTLEELYREGGNQNIINKKILIVFDD